MIGIVNISESKGVSYSKEGLQHYRVQINEVPLTEFEHFSKKGPEGIATLLESAAAALRKLGDIDIDSRLFEYRRKELERFLDLHLEGSSYEN